MAIASPGSSDRTTKGDRHPGPIWVSDRVMTCHDLLRLQISKLAFLVKEKKKEKKKRGRAVHSMGHIDMCSAVFGKAKAVQECTRKENK